MNQETIERAARALSERIGYGSAWELHSDKTQSLYMDAARAVIAAIHPTVDSVEELDALALGTVVRDAQHETWELTDNGWRYWVYDEYMESFQLALPATVLYIPGGAA